VWSAPARAGALDTVHSEVRRHWPHAPQHRLSEAGTFIVTAGTYGKVPFFSERQRLDALHGGLLKYARRFGRRLEAWAVFSNHFHFAGHSPGESDGGAASLAVFLKRFHCLSKEWVNRLDKTPGRHVWHNYWETRLTFERRATSHA
jgi:putative transposase